LPAAPRHNRNANGSKPACCAPPSCSPSASAKPRSLARSASRDADLSILEASPEVKQYRVTYLAQIRDHSGVRFGRELILERTQNLVC
jgi:hypothetical protein